MFCCYHTSKERILQFRVCFDLYYFTTTDNIMLTVESVFIFKAHYFLVSKDRLLFLLLAVPEHKVKIILETFKYFFLSFA